VTGLIAAQKYWVNVVAVNSLGQSPYAYAGSIIATS